MRPRTDVAVALGALTVLLAIAGARGWRARPRDSADTRVSTFLAGRGGAKGLADAMTRLGVTVERSRERAAMWRVPPNGPGVTYVVADPTVPVTDADLQSIVSLPVEHRRAALALIGDGTEPLMRCFGYQLRRTVFDSARVTRPGRGASDDAAWVHARLDHRVPNVVVDSLFGAVADTTCHVPAVARVDTLLLSTDRRPVALRLELQESRGRVLLVADAALVRNATLRSTSTGPLVLDAIVMGNRRVVFDEYHLGFGPGGSMLRVTLDWAARSPWGWATLQLLVVALVAYLTSGVRFGPPRRALPRTRRSSLEHVRALATALSAAKGHDVAVGSMVRGLRRRLSPAGRRSTRQPARHSARRDDWRPWLDELVRHAPNARARERAGALASVAAAPTSDAAVLAAANAVEDLWTDVRR